MPKTTNAPTDDFTQIAGIGQRTQDKLQAAGIRTYADLAQATAAAIKAAIKTGQHQIEAWQAAARRLAQDEPATAAAYQHTNAKGQTYLLHAKETRLKSGRAQVIYFFAKEQKEGALAAVPDGYEVSETRNGLPVLKKVKQ